MADRITIDGKEYRVEVNINTITHLCQLKGVDDLTRLGEISRMKVTELPQVIYRSLQEGAEADGKELDITLEQMKRGLRMPIVREFAEIFARQINGEQFPAPAGTAKPSAGHTAKKKSLFRFWSSRRG